MRHTNRIAVYNWLFVLNARRITVVRRVVRRVVTRSKNATILVFSFKLVAFLFKVIDVVDYNPPTSLGAARIEVLMVLPTISTRAWNGGNGNGMPCSAKASRIF